MQVELELLGALRERFADRFRGGRGQVELPAGATIAELLEEIGLGRNARCAVTVDNQVVADRSRPLSPGAKVLIIAPVAGGRDEDSWSR